MQRAVDQAVQEEFFFDCLTDENGTDTLSRNFGGEPRET
jgi:hypothetical protein